jgi:putative tryptophan/tyrosine transport system permease protein
MNFILDVIIQGLLYSVLAMGVALTFKVLRSADLTVEGSFPLGAVVGAISLIEGFPIPLVLLLAFTAGWLAVVTSWLQLVLKIQPLLSGILTMSGLYTINLVIAQNRSNLPLFQTTTLFTRPSWISN